MESLADLTRFFDSTLLKFDTNHEALERLALDARSLSCYAVCVYPTDIAGVRPLLEGSGVRIATVAGFPTGRHMAAVKESEIFEAAEAGADEVDVVLNYSALIAGNIPLVAEELDRCVSAAHQNDLLLKVIVETCFLTEDQKVQALHLCEEAGADFIKTSTGFGTGGATVDDIRLWASNRKSIRIKASGGIRSLADATGLITAGADRLGLSSAAAIAAEFNGDTPPSDSTPAGSY